MNKAQKQLKVGGQQSGELQRLLSMVDQMSLVVKKNGDDDANTSQALLQYYLQNVQGLDQEGSGSENEAALKAFNDLFEKLQWLQKEYSKLEKTKQASLPSPPSEIPQNLRQMLKLQTAVISIQAWWRKVYTLKKLERDAKQSLSNLTSMKKSGMTPEEAAMKEFALQLKAKKLTPESFFRIVDTDYKQQITNTAFKEALSALNIQLSRAQVSRLIMILDEDIEGTITLEEYNNALEAYNVSAEKHRPLDGSVLYHPFEHKCLFKLISELRKKNITFLEVYNACDVNEDGRVNVSELRNFVEGLTPDFKQKEIHALMIYMDIDKNGIIDREEFLRQLTKGEQTMRQTQSLNKQLADRRVLERSSAGFTQQKNNFMTSSFASGAAGGDDSFLRFEVEDMAMGDESFLPVQEEIISPVKKGAQSTYSAAQNQGSLTQDQLKRKQIVEKMEKEGISLTSFLQSLKRQAGNGMVQLGTLLKSLETNYPTVPFSDRNFLVKECIKERTKVDFVQFEELISRFAKNLLPSTALTFQTLATNIVKQMGGGSLPAESIKLFFKAQSMGEADMLSETEFSQIFSKMGIPQLALSQAFSSLNLDTDGFVVVRDLNEVLLSYVTLSSGTRVLSSAELKKLIPNIDTMSPRTRTENVITFVSKELSGKGMKALSVFKMADPSNTNMTKAVTLEASFKKLLPNMSAEIVSELLQAFKVTSPQSTITRAEFEAAFANEALNSSTVALQKSPLKAQQASQSKVPDTAGGAQKVDDYSLKWIRKLYDAMIREKVTPSMTFKTADTNKNNLITPQELKEAIKLLIPEDTLSFLDIKQIMMAFDIDRNGTIDEKEFLTLFEKVQKLAPSILGQQEQQTPSPQNNAVEDRRSKLPLKGNLGDKTAPAQEPTSNMSLLVNNIDEHINIKKVFGELPMTQEGRIVASHIQRRLKSETAPDGSTLKPSDYLPIIKALDSSGSGSIDVIAIIQFLERHCKTYALDSTLELKYIANFIEFKMKNTNTKLFFDLNTKLRSGSRLLEVEVMSELNKAFNIPLQVGNTIYKRLGKQDAQLEDLCSLIDEYRIVKVEKQKTQLTEAQKLDPDQILAKLKQVFNELPKRIRDEVAQNLRVIDQTEKQIPYADFFKEFVEENQLITNPESKALYQHLKTKGTVSYQALQSVGLFPQDQQQTVTKQIPEQQSQKQQQQQPTQVPPAQPQTLDLKLLVKSIEDQLGGKSLEEVLGDEMFREDQISVMGFNRKITQASSTVDKKALTVLAQMLGKSKPGTLLIIEIVQALKELPGKYKQEDVVSSLGQGIEEPLAKTLEDNGFTQTDYYSKNDYLEALSLSMKQTCNVSVFKQVCLFYDLSEQQDELFGKTLVQKLLTVAKAQLNSSSGSIKKAVTFGEPMIDEAQIKQLMTEFIGTYRQITTEANIQSSLNKFTQVLKQFKTQGDAISKFDSSGKGILHIDWFRKKLDELQKFTTEEKIFLTFLPIEKGNQEPSQINIANYFKFIRNITNIDGSIVAQNKTKIQQIYEIIRKLVGGPPLEEPQKKNQQEEEISATSGLGGIKRMDTYNRMKHEKIQKLLGVMETNLKDPQKRQNFIKLFDNQNNQNQWIQEDVLINHMEKEWGYRLNTEEQDELEKQVDKNQLGRFQLRDIVEFCKREGIDLGYQGILRKGTIEQRLENKTGAKMKCGTLEYIFDPKIDCYNGISTILTSEEAALVVAEKLYNEIEKDGEFFDPDFGPQSQDDLEGSYKAMYPTKQFPPGYPNPEIIEWLRPGDYSTDDYDFIAGGASANDVRQGRIGDCWLISALSVLATRDELIRGSVGNIEVTSEFKANQEIALEFSKGVYPPLFHIYRKKGIYVFRFFKNFKWVFVLIDDRLPCQNLKPVFATCKNPNEFWVPLIEKAYAKLHGCYYSLVSGYIDDALSELTGYVAYKTYMHDKLGNFPSNQTGSKDEFWQQLKLRVKEKSLMGCSRSSTVGEKEYLLDGERTGIFMGHAYGIMDAFEIPDPEMINPRKTHRLIRVRNPHGQGEWRGKWSDRSDEIEIYKKQIQDYVSSLTDADEKFNPGDDDGTFLINYKNWRTIFNNVFYCLDFPNHWNGLRYQAQWDETCSGGVPSPLTEENKVRWSNNPQFCITSQNQEMELFVSLAQPDGRGQKFNGQAIKFPYAEVIHPVVFSVFLIPFDIHGPNGQPPKLQKFDQKYLKGVTVLKEHKEVSMRFKVGPGHIIIVPSTSKPGEYGQFTLSIYFDKSKSKVHLYRLDKPDQNNFYVIQEESENAEGVEDWKVKLCQERITTMIVEDDYEFDTPARMGEINPLQELPSLGGKAVSLAPKAASLGSVQKVQAGATKKLSSMMSRGPVRKKSIIQSGVPQDSGSRIDSNNSGGGGNSFNMNTE